MAAATSAKAEPWRRRLYLPNYQVGEAARYARVSPRTVAEWHKVGSRQTLSQREQRAALSYMQLIEVAVVAAFRNAGVPLREIRANREYVASQLKSEFPFAEYRFKTDGKSMFMDYAQIDGKTGKGKLLRASRGGQLAWEDIIGRLEEFDYEREGIVVRWHVAGPGSRVVIDPRIGFGTPTVRGTPTWVVSGRWNAGEKIEDIGDDFNLDEQEVREALAFEGIELDAKTWAH